MKYILICDYPYHTTKNFFETIEEANSFLPENDKNSMMNRLLNGRIYLLTSYRENIVEGKTIINYSVDLDSRKNIEL